MVKWWDPLMVWVRERDDVGEDRGVVVGDGEGDDAFCIFFPV